MDSCLGQQCRGDNTFDTEYQLFPFFPPALVKMRFDFSFFLVYFFLFNSPTKADKAFHQGTNYSFKKKKKSVHFDEKHFVIYTAKLVSYWAWVGRTRMSVWYLY